MSEFLIEQRVTIPPDAPCFQGHFPTDPVAPAAWLLSDVILARVEFHWPDLGPLLAVPRVKFLAAVRPGDVLRVELRRTAESVRFHIVRGDSDVSRGSLQFRIAVHQANAKDAAES